MAGVFNDPQKWNMPGWRIDQKYKSGVLMGNWDEDRKNFTKGNYKHNSTHRIDFVNYGSYQPDVIARRQAQLNSLGLSSELLLHHHGNKYDNNLVTWYDEDYNGRWREKGLPPLRHYNHHSLKWEPEKSDFLVQEPPTNFGLLSSLQNEWATQMNEQWKSDYRTTYSVSYCPYQSNQMVKTRYAVPVWDSSTLHPVNKTLKDLHLRNTPLLKCPELMPAEMTYVSM